MSDDYNDDLFADFESFGLDEGVSTGGLNYVTRVQVKPGLIVFDSTNRPNFFAQKPGPGGADVTKAKASAFARENGKEDWQVSEGLQITLSHESMLFPVPAPNWSGDFDHLVLKKFYSRRENKSKPSKSYAETRKSLVRGMESGEGQEKWTWAWVSTPLDLDQKDEYVGQELDRDTWRYPDGQKSRRFPVIKEVYASKEEAQKKAEELKLNAASFGENEATTTSGVRGAAYGVPMPDSYKDWESAMAWEQANGELVKALIEVRDDKFSSSYNVPLPDKELESIIGRWGGAVNLETIRAIDTKMMENPPAPF